VNKILIIFNPAARSERASRLRSRLEGLSPNIVVRVTGETGDARRLAEEAVKEGFETILAAGGDGTVNEVVNGLAGARVRLGILPVGTMNVFASELGIPQGNLEEAWEVVERGGTREIDLPQANGQYFIQLAGVGLDAEVVRKTTRNSKNTFGPLSYLLTLAQVVAVKPPRVLVEVEGGEEREGSFVLIGNGRFYGGPFPLFKKASLHDRLLDVIVFQNQSPLDVVRYFQAIAFGTHPDLPDVEYFQAKAVRVTSADEVPVELDGEVAGTLPCAFSIAEERLIVLVPEGGAGVSLKCDA
jgi:YegS/Rv2252/BmrU family lipid kinase